MTLRTPPAPDRIGLLWVPEQAKEQFTVCQAEIVAVGDQCSDPRLQPGLRVVTRRFGAFSHDAARTLWTVYTRDLVGILDMEVCHDAA